MAKKLTVLLIILIILTAPKLLAQVYYTKILDSVDNYNHIDPIKDADNELIGFIYTDTHNKQLIVDYIYNDSQVVIPTEHYPMMTINYSDELDLNVYVVYDDTLPEVEFRHNSRVQRIIINESIKFDSLIIQRAASYRMLRHMLNNKISFYKQANERVGIITNVTIRTFEYYETIGPIFENASVSNVYNLGLDSLLISRSASNLEAGNLYSLDSLGYVAYSDNYYLFDYNIFPGDTNNGITLSSSLWSRALLDDDFVFYKDLAYKEIYKIMVDNFDISNDLDEVIYFGTLPDVTGIHTDTVSHVACLSMADGNLNQLWYRELSEVSLDYIYHPFNAIAGRNNYNQMILLDYTTGIVEVSHSFNRELSMFEYFDTGTDQPMLNALGVNGDTLFLYRFDTPTDIVEYNEVRELPETFELHQNFPNPFNASTSISFSNFENQQIELAIYNILGQNIKTLTSGYKSVGDFIYYWDGLDENGNIMPTGIYFARLVTDNNSELIKLVMLK